MQFLEQLKSKQSHIKTQIAFVSAVSVTGIIGLVWASTLPAQFNKIGDEVVLESEAQTATAGNALDELIAGVTKGMDTLETEEETPEDAFVSDMPSGSALDELSGWRTQAEMERLVPEEGSLTQPAVIESSTSPLSPPTPSPTPAPAQAPSPAVESDVLPPQEEPSVSVSETPKTPTVILIGTTTKKTE